MYFLENVTVWKQIYTLACDYLDTITDFVRDKTKIMGLGLLSSAQFVWQTWR